MRARVGLALPHTRCHGTWPALTLSAAAATRAPRGMPASSAIWPYVAMRPRGIRRITA